MKAASVTKIEQKGAVGLSEQQFIDVLKNSLYPGAKDESIRLVMAYCEAAKLDVMQKPVHIVPMQVSTGRKNNSGYDIKEYRDVVMPGIGLYRIQASRTNSYAGISEPEFGEEVTATINEIDVTYPKWCRITVEKVVGGQIRQFSAKEFWLENYATKSKDSTAPNAMWRKRPYAQIAKCAEAQALRKAFPDTVGAAPTAEEMEGKEYDVSDFHDSDDIFSGKPQVKLPQSKSEQSLPESPSPQTYDATPEQEPQPQQAATSALPATVGEKNFLTNKAKSLGVSLEEAMRACKLSGDFEKLTADGFIALKEFFAEKARG